MALTASGEQLDTVEQVDRAFRLRFCDGHESVYHWIWLRDNWPAESLFAPGTRQRRIDAASLDPEVSPVEFAVSPAALQVTWSDGARVDYDADWLRANDYSDAARAARAPRPRLWDHQLQTCFPRHTYADVQADEAARLRFLGDLLDYGVALLEDVPGESRRVLEVARLLGYPRETNYGDLFDVRSKPGAANLAYSALGLALHTDNPYRHPVGGYQLLHCLQASDSGGESQFVDGFCVAEELRRVDPTAFATLARIPRLFRFQSDSADLQHSTPLLICDGEGRLQAVRRNDRSASTLSVPPHEVEPYYDAYRKFVQLLEAPRFLVQFRLASGELVVFDNERVLHARTAFDPEAGPRHLQGCYIDRDEVASRARLLAQQLGLVGRDPGAAGGVRLASGKSA